MNDWDSTTINVVTDDDYYDIELWSCLRCGSLVKQGFKETHEKWHREARRWIGTECVIGWALTGVESYEHRQARLSEDTPERILTDLIAELRAENEWHFTAMANRAEARLKEVQG